MKLTREEAMARRLHDASCDARLKEGYDSSDFEIFWNELAEEQRRVYRAMARAALEGCHEFEVG